eukprot:c26236_g1_i1.p1 GENE.c26236_g1_i1~~c26236_g1_i1.p1  ORF type:complete len:356 (+),score=58.75 c26236_g1_i1:26-1069(+)
MATEQHDHEEDENEDRLGPTTVELPGDPIPVKQRLAQIWRQMTWANFSKYVYLRLCGFQFLFMGLTGLACPGYVPVSYFKLSDGLPYECLAYFGAILSSLPLFLHFYFLGNLHRYALVFGPDPGARRAYLPVLATILGAGLSVFGYVRSGVDWSLSAPLALFSTLVCLLHEFWYARCTPVKSQALAVGQKLPNLDLIRVPDQVRFTSHSDLPRKPLILAFIRGIWDQFDCHHIIEISKLLKKDQVDAELIVISPYPVTNAQLEKFQSELAVPVIFLLDFDNEFTSKLGIRMIGSIPPMLGELDDFAAPVPTTLVCSPTWDIVFSFHAKDYRGRPNVEDVVRAAVVRK